VHIPAPARSLSRSTTGFIAALSAAALLLTGCSSPTPGDDDTAETPETRVVTDALGEVTVPVDPQRVVATDFFSSSMLVDVGVVPVGVMQGIQEPDSRPERYMTALADAAQVSTYAEINVEMVLDLDPDLIIIDSNFGDAETVERLADIAPLFNVDLSGSWSERALSVADAVGRLDEAEKQQQEYLDRAQEISEEYRDVLDANPLAVVSLNTTDATWAHYAPGGWPTPAWIDVDAVFREPTDGEAKSSAEWAWISDEQIGKLDNAGIIVVLEEDQLARYADNPIWNALPAVVAGNVFSDFPSPATSSFAWGMDNLDTIDGILAQVKGV
jgi:iron complex transport system substrate-binding protein